MRKLIISTFLIFTFQIISASVYTTCKLIMSDNSEKFGQAMKPNMLDKTIKFVSENSQQITFKSDEIQSIEFTENGKFVRYERVLTYRNYSNKNINKTKSWLKVEKSGYVTLYFGFQQGINSPSMNLWYCLRNDEKVAYFISMTYSGGLTMTVGTGSTFIKNASFYFSDYPELVNKIKVKEYKFNDLGTIVDVYNNWKGNKS